MTPIVINRSLERSKRLEKILISFISSSRMIQKNFQILQLSIQNAEVLPEEEILGNSVEEICRNHSKMPHLL
ncbi:UNVERIFIED_CONTAM: hypothetical protein GTU68_064532 [Idotea baltica]|nr:hypothetical protein [Idotea baltica]